MTININVCVRRYAIVCMDLKSYYRKSQHQNDALIIGIWMVKSNVCTYKKWVAGVKIGYVIVCVMLRNWMRIKMYLCMYGKRIYIWKRLNARNININVRIYISVLGAAKKNNGILFPDKGFRFVLSGISRRCLIRGMTLSIFFSLLRNANCDVIHFLYGWFFAQITIKICVN